MIEKCKQIGSKIINLKVVKQRTFKHYYGGLWGERSTNITLWIIKDIDRDKNKFCAERFVNGHRQQGWHWWDKATCEKTYFDWRQFEERVAFDLKHQWQKLSLFQGDL